MSNPFIPNPATSLDHNDGSSARNLPSVYRKHKLQLESQNAVLCPKPRKAWNEAQKFLSRFYSYEEAVFKPHRCPIGLCGCSYHEMRG